MEFKEFLENYKPYFITSFLTGLIHDIGKQSLLFIKSATKRSEKKSNIEADEAHTKRELFEEDFILAFNNFIDYIVEQSKIEEPDIIQKNTFMDIITNHHNDGELDKLSKSNYIVNVVFSPGCDGMDSGFDKGNAQYEQDIESFSTINFAGKAEKLDVDKFDERRKDLEKEIINIISSNKDGYEKILKVIKQVTKKVIDFNQKALAETRLPSNDSKLADHLYSVGSLSKSLIVKLLWEYLHKEDKSQLINWNFFKAEAKWQLLVVKWNFDKYLENIRRVSDLSGRINLLEKYQEKLRDIIEYNYFLGSQVYKDNSKSIFLLPGFDVEFIKDNMSFLIDEIINNFPELLHGESVLKIYALKRPDSNILRISHAFSDTTDEYYDLVKTKYFGAELNKNIRKQIEEHGWNHVLCDVCKSNLAKPKTDEDNICIYCEKIRSYADETKIKDIESIDKSSLAVVYIRLPVEEWLSGKMLKTIRMRYEKLVDNEIFNKASRAFEEFKSIMIEKNIITTLDAWQECKNLFNSGYKDILTPSEVEKLIKKMKLQSIIKIRWIKDKLGVNNEDEAKFSFYVFCFMLEELFIQYLDEIYDMNFMELSDMFYHKYPSPSRIRRIIKDSEKFLNDIIQECSNMNIKNRVLIKSPNQAAILIPAGNLIEYVSYIYESYKQEFPLTFGRFPIYIFAGIFRTKFPLYVVLESIKHLSSVKFEPIILKYGRIKRVIENIGKNYEILENVKDFYLNFFDKDNKVVSYKELSNNNDIKYMHSIFDFIIFDSPDRRFETLNYKNGFTKRYSKDFDTYIERILLDLDEFDELDRILKLFDAENTAAVYKFMDIIYKSYKSWYIPNHEDTNKNAWENFIQDSINIFFKKANIEDKNILKKFCLDLKIFEIFDLWKYLSKPEESSEEKHG